MRRGLAAPGGEGTGVPSSRTPPPQGGQYAMHVHTSPIPHTESGMISFFILYFSLEDTWAKYKSALDSAAREVLGPRLSVKKPYGFLRPLSVLSIN